MWNIFSNSADPVGYLHRTFEGAFFWGFQLNSTWNAKQLQGKSLSILLLWKTVEGITFFFASFNWMQNFEKKFSVALQIPSVGRSFMYRRSLGPRMEPFITEKRLDKARYPILNLIKLKFVNKTSIPNAVESPAYIKWYSSSRPRPIKNPRNSLIVRKSVVDQDQKSHQKSVKRSCLFRWSTSLLFTSFSKTLLRQTRPSHRSDFNTIWKTRFFRTHTDEFIRISCKFRLIAL